MECASLEKFTDTTSHLIFNTCLFTILLSQCVDSFVIQVKFSSPFFFCKTLLRQQKEAFTHTHTHKRTHTFCQARPRQLMGPSDFTDKHTYASSETQWKSILCACFSSNSHRPSVLPSLYQTSPAIPAGPPLKTTGYTPQHTHVPTDAQANHRGMMEPY